MKLNYRKIRFLVYYLGALLLILIGLTELFLSGFKEGASKVFFGVSWSLLTEILENQYSKEK